MFPSHIALSRFECIATKIWVNFSRRNLHMQMFLPKHCELIFFEIWWFVADLTNVPQVFEVKVQNWAAKSVHSEIQVPNSSRPRHKSWTRTVWFRLGSLIHFWILIRPSTLSFLWVKSSPFFPFIHCFLVCLSYCWCNWNRAREVFPIVFIMETHIIMLWLILCLDEFLISIVYVYVCVWCICLFLFMFFFVSDEITISFFSVPQHRNIARDCCCFFLF